MDKKLLTLKDCIIDSHYNEDYAGKIIVLRPEALKTEYRDERFQLWLGRFGFGCDPLLRGRSVFATCLYDNEKAEWVRESFYGAVKPESLPDWAKLKLSQINPGSSAGEHEQTPKYRGYSFLENGRHEAGVWLCSEKEVMEYIDLQKNYQHRVMICDRGDCNVLELVKGRIVHPSREELETILARHEGSMQMNL